jgi:hypothetical protein
MKYNKHIHHHAQLSIVILFPLSNYNKYFTLFFTI